MARKKRRPPRNSGVRPEPLRSKLGPIPGPPDRRVFEGAMRKHLRELSGGDPVLAPLDRAHEVLLQAYQTPDPDRKAVLAKLALKICPDCADAYVLLAELSGKSRQALELYEKGVAAGERALGPEAFRENAGHFWGVLETRPYMRAREGLA